MTVYLTPRQVDILRLIAKGMSNTEIALELGISERTIDAHLVRLREVIGTLSWRRLVVFAVKYADKLERTNDSTRRSRLDFDPID